MNDGRQAGEPSPTPLGVTERERLARTAVALLHANDTGAFIKPARHQYPHQWAWDAAFVAIGLRHVDPDLAARELRALLGAQWANGMVPHIVYHHGPSDYFPTPDFWRTERAAHVGPVASSGLTQPPVLATALRLLSQSLAPEAGLRLVRELFPKVLAYHSWLRAARDPDDTGLVAIVHPWESGTDDAPRFTAALAALGEPSPPSFERRDQRHVPTEQRPTTDTYARFMHLIGLFRELAWDDEAVYRRSPFLVQDVLFNAVLHRADADLAELARTLGEPTHELDRWRSATRSALDRRLWDDRVAIYRDYDLRAAAGVDVTTWAGFAPLYARACDGDAAQRMVDAHLRDPARFGHGGIARFMLPTVPVTGRHFEPRRYWRGPVWVNANWMVARGLRWCGEHELADTLATHILELVSTRGFREYYDSRDGTGLGAEGFSWSAALALDLLHDPEGV